MEEHKAQAIESYLDLGGPLEGICFQAVFLILFLLMEKTHILIMEETERFLSLVRVHIHGLQYHN